MTKPFFITLEGVDGIGKSTQLQCIAQWLRQKGIKVCCTQEPLGGTLGKQLTQLLKHDVAMSPFSEALLFSAARIEHIMEVIVPALQNGQWVLCDRYIHSTRAYQVPELSAKEKDLYERIESYCLTQAQPNMTFILDGEPHGSLALGDIFEERGSDYMKTIRERYQKMTDCVMIDGNQAADQVTQDIIAHLERR